VENHENNALINDSFPCDLINNLINNINSAVSNAVMVISYIEINQIEVHNFISRPDFIFEKLVNCTDTKTVMSAQIQILKL
jgi:hypothetical protein